MATVDIFQICKNKCGFYCWWWYQPPKWWPPMKAHLGRWANLNTSYICNLRSLWCKGWGDHFRICSFHIFQKPTLNILPLKFVTIAIKRFATGETGTGQQQMGRGHLGLLRWKSTKPNQTKPNQTKPNQNKTNQTKPNQAKPSQTKPNQPTNRPTS